MQDWKIIRPIIAKILKNQRYNKSEKHLNESCFLTSYQIAVLVDKEDPSLKGGLPIGGAGTGPDSFSKKIAWNLSHDASHPSEELNHDVFKGKLEIKFFSIAGLDSFTFSGGHSPADNEFSMFRINDEVGA